MKFGLQSKLLLPTISTLLILMFATSILVSKIITSQLEKDTADMMAAGNKILVKNISGAAANYRDSLNAMSLMVRFKPLMNHLTNQLRPNERSKEEALEMVQKLLESFPSIYHNFMQFNFADLKGDVIASSNKKSVNKVNVGNRGYFRDALTGKVVISEPIVSRSLGEKTVIVAAPVTNSQGQIGGVLYAIMSCKKIVEDTIAGIKIGKGGFYYIVDSASGLMLAHPDYSKIQSMNMFKSQPWMSSIKKGESGIKTDYRSSNGKRRMIAYNNDGGSGWIAISVFNYEELEEQSSFITYISVACMFGLAFIVCIIIFIVVRSMVKDVRKTNDFAQAIADGDLKRQLDVHRTDELGALGDALRKMVTSLESMIALSKEESEKAKIEAEKTKEAMEEANLERHKVKEGQERIMQVAERLKKMIQVITSDSAEISVDIEQSNKSANESAQRLADAATAMKEMNSTVQDVARNAANAASVSAETKEKAEYGAEIVKKSVVSIAEMRDASLALKGDMTELSEHAQSISQIMNVISDIADQTNLLALNAAIEAARAGDAGRGFAVVADEVRKLAEKTMSSTVDVGRATDSIRQSTAKTQQGLETAIARLEEATQYAKQSGEALQEIVAKVEATTDQVNAIATASEEQSAASEEINHSVVEVSALSAQTAEAMSQATKAIADLTQQTKQLSSLMQEMRH
ncbi:MAG: HAMP domain-containing protein [Desulfovibrio sp.]|nr:HAMP domain-containing protein [Desulfovibrio sp.]